MLKKKRKTSVGQCVSCAAHLTDVEPKSHVFLLNAEPLGQVDVDIFNGVYAAEAAGVGQHPLQRSVGGWNTTC